MHSWHAKFKSESLQPLEILRHKYREEKDQNRRFREKARSLNNPGYSKLADSAQISNMSRYKTINTKNSDWDSQAFPGVPVFYGCETAKPRMSLIQAHEHFNDWIEYAHLCKTWPFLTWIRCLIFA
ncbi:hypothetical protein BDZ45DRAFT_667214 [Acephala macrosclerotiorum]|nr:hypothetical protein BDZ45DRAFT_667214 [Acephala macrosclerotiorum]